MKVARNRDQIVLRLESGEREILLGSLLALRKHYQTELSQLSEALQHHWRGTLTRGDGAEEIPGAAEELEAERLSWRPQRVALLDKWLAQGSPLQSASPASLTLSEGEFDEFLAMLNDRRITLAVAHGVTEEQMEWNPLTVQSRELQKALWEIHFLAFLQESCVSSLLEE
ncbi:hypothetical protein MAMC_02079 [Methylacidimicrobium cyclopophantes]|uniref:Uncharacterized protein n=1 Tax=Methylacidimicrobium cyclopophantes TaxID=1041766 RepID=A0A5E6MR95_9BACT|nr:DUF2017 family protein [Methylacidimicrobium cyclopophantes]VVM08367.1 hypothetical protein MAMC_02079 [Methylacidimicrobium cyclopophantes]